MPEYLYHLVPADQWTTVREERQPYFPPSYDHDGFIHLTKKPELLLPVANHFYKDVPGGRPLLPWARAVSLWANDT